MENKKIVLILEKDTNGKYVYKGTEVVKAETNYGTATVIQMDKYRYANFKDRKNTKIVSKNFKDSKKLVIELDSVIRDSLLEECKSRGMNELDGYELIKDALNTLCVDINGITVATHGGLTSLDIDFVKKKKRKEVNGNEVSDGSEEIVDAKENFTIDLTDINPSEIIKRIKTKVIAQDAAVETIVNNVYNNQMVFNTNDPDYIDTEKCTILLDGPTGTGKTLIIKQVAREMKLPMIVRSSTMFSAAGYKGADLSELLVALLKETDGNLELAERGIIALDEFDKLAGNDNSELEMRKAVQQELLTYFSGAKFPVEYKGKTYEFDTSKLTFICLGAFTDLRERKIEEGLDENGNYTMTPEDYINEGLLRELVGRFSLRTSTQHLSKENLKSILVSSKISPLKSLERTAKRYNKTITYSDEVIDRIAGIAVELKTGARSLKDVVHNIKNVILSDLINSEITEIEITEDIILESLKVNERKGIVK